MGHAGGQGVHLQHPGRFRRGGGVGTQGHQFVCSRLEQADTGLDGLLNSALLERYRSELEDLPGCLRGTTHISIIDGSGNQAALTLSNGEGCGHLIPPPHTATTAAKC